MSNNGRLILHVGETLEADSVIAALNDADIPAYKKDRPNSGLLAIPGAYGMSENGYDIFVSPESEKKAAEVLLGLGYDSVAELVADDDGQQADKEKFTGTEDDFENTVESIDEDDEEVNPVKETFSKILLIVLALFLISGTVWFVDFIMEWIKSLV